MGQSLQNNPALRNLLLALGSGLTQSSQVGGPGMGGIAPAISNAFGVYGQSQAYHAEQQRKQAAAQAAAQRQAELDRRSTLTFEQGQEDRTRAEAGRETAKAAAERAQTEAGNQEHQDRVRAENEINRRAAGDRVEQQRLMNLYNTNPKGFWAEVNKPAKTEEPLYRQGADGRYYQIEDGKGTPVEGMPAKPPPAPKAAEEGGMSAAEKRERDVAINIAKKNFDIDNKRYLREVDELNEALERQRDNRGSNEPSYIPQTPTPPRPFDDHLREAQGQGGGSAPPPPTETITRPASGGMPPARPTEGPAAAPAGADPPPPAPGEEPSPQYVDQVAQGLVAMIERSGWKPGPGAAEALKARWQEIRQTMPAKEAYLQLEAELESQLGIKFPTE